MPDRRSHASAPWIACTLALLASGPLAPSRSSGMVAASARPDCVRPDPAVLPGRPAAYLTAATAGDVVPRVAAVLSESNEQEEADALVQPGSLATSPFPPRKPSHRRLIAPLPALSPYPLRC